MSEIAFGSLTKTEFTRILVGCMTENPALFDPLFAAYIEDNPSAFDTAIAAYLNSHSISGGESGAWISGGGLLASTTLGATGPIAPTELSTNKINRVVMQFTNSGAKEYAEVAFRMPLNYDGGTVTATFFWSAAGTGTESVVWGAQARALVDGGSLDQAYGTAQEISDAHTATANALLISSATPAITIAGSPAAGGFTQWRFYRDSANGTDTLAQTCELAGVYLSWLR